MNPKQTALPMGQFLRTLADALEKRSPEIVEIKKITFTKIHNIVDGKPHDWRVQIQVEERPNKIVDISWEHIDTCEWVPVVIK